MFLLPALAFLAVFIVWPIVSSVRLSFYVWNGISASRNFAGMANWAELLGDGVFWKALLNNLIVVILSIVVQMPVAMGLAVLLHRGGKALKPFKVVYFFPMLMSTVAVGVLFKAVYDVNFGAINPLAEALGLHGIAPGLARRLAHCAVFRRRGGVLAIYTFLHDPLPGASGRHPV